MGKQYFIYIMTNIVNTVLYTGVTSDLIRRAGQHKEGTVPGFASRYNTVKLIYYECTCEALSAIAREKKIKKMYRKQKEDLINSFNPGWRDLYYDLTDSGDSRGCNRENDNEKGSA